MSQTARVRPATKVRRAVRQPAIAIVPKTFQDCLEAGFTLREIAAHLGLVYETMMKRVNRDPELLALLEHGPHLRKRALKLLQWAKAKQGNVPMLIHLGRAELGQDGQTQAAAGGTWLVESRPVVSPEQWVEQYGPLRGGKPPREGG